MKCNSKWKKPMTTMLLIGKKMKLTKLKEKEEWNENETN